jgi:hypothetical protein
VLAEREELIRPGVMAVIEDMVRRGMTGVLELEGNPSGRVYLDGGKIAYARASWVPGLAARLRAIAPSLVSEQPPPSRDAADAAAARFVVGHGYLTTTSLHELIKSIVVDVFLVLTIPLAEDYPIAAVRFTQTQASWTGLFPRLALAVVRGEAVSRAERMAEYGVSPTTAVVPRDLTMPAAVLTREQWAVACQIGDRVSARELAMRRGASLSDTVHCLGSLVRAGLCAPVPAPAQTRPPAIAVRQHGRPQRPVSKVQPPSLEVLRRVLTGLRRLLRAGDLRPVGDDKQQDPGLSYGPGSGVRRTQGGVWSPAWMISLTARQAAPVQAMPVQAAPVQATPVQAAAVQATAARGAPVQAPARRPTRPTVPCCGRYRGPTSCSPTPGCGWRRNGSAGTWSRPRSPARRTGRGQARSPRTGSRTPPSLNCLPPRRR